NESEALLALVDGNFVSLRIPYPMGFYAKGIDGRIDDPRSGWKGKGIWTTFATRTPFHVEGGKGTTSKILKFQVRPDPLAKYVFLTSRLSPEEVAVFPESAFRGFFAAPRLETTVFTKGENTF